VKKNKTQNISKKNIENAKSQGEFKDVFLSRNQLIWRAFKKHKLAMIGLNVLIVFYIVALFADFVVPYNIYNQSLDHSYAPPTKLSTKYQGHTVAPYVMPFRMVINESTGEKMPVNMYFFNRLKFANGTTITTKKTQNIKFITYYRRYLYLKGENKPILIESHSEVKQYLDKNELPLLKTGKLKFTETSAIAKEKVANYYNEKFVGSVYGNSNSGYKRINENGIEKIVTTKDLMAIEFIKNNSTIELIDSPKVVSYDYNIYPIRFFVKGWEGKMLFFIPFKYHLFGVVNYDNNPYVKYFLLGSDMFGRDQFSRIIKASRISLSIGLVGIFITFILGLFFGGISGYYGGIVDDVLMRFAELIMSIPGFYLLILLRAILPLDIPSTQVYILIVFILSFISWAGLSRVIRGMVLSISRREFVDAAKTLGYPDSKIIWKHIIPNTSTYLIVRATLDIPSYILGEAALSFLNLGIREPDASWGLMLSQAQNMYVLTKAPWLLLPGVFIFIAVLSFNFLGDGLRDAFDPKALG
jgi:peptide/nickel transport system permease protein